MKKKKAFTLVEVLIVLVVIGALMVVLIPGIVNKSQEANKQSTEISNHIQEGYAEYSNFKDGK
ncbi:prepilin-type N-terminal cleavage/methylation domain-containing protein [uncultured Enterococcus sp.]|uniref:prepilin-type N-terminal cleavage/methylation domain-containing protein n=1 Tax=uncultured Enterococcus sp. TaxID=167972 RepID=UPI0025CE050F|nr:prepilin-type N-terminal cleavage/methylation domain-containing protein [uncultured Enterococcus sp.]